MCPSRLRPPVVLLFLLMMLGCGDTSGVGKTYPVAGKITFKNELWSPRPDFQILSMFVSLAA